MRLLTRRYSIDLPRHMAVCDANFLRLMKLFPAMREEHKVEFCVSPGDTSVRVRLQVLERGPFTTVLGLLHLGEGEGEGQGQGEGEGEGERERERGNRRAGHRAGHREGNDAVEPTFKIRVYHDARSAEVFEFQRQTRFSAVYDYPNPRMRQRDEKAQVNLFLGEVLAHCLRFGVASASALVSISG